MTSPDKFSLLRNLLRALGLSTEAVDDILDRISEWLNLRDDEPSQPRDCPYLTRDDFLSPAELNFYLVLKSAVADWALVCPKVALADLFYAKTSDPSLYRSYTNRIDRKHIDFLLCDPQTVRPLLGIELDDKSHQRADRKVRDEFVAKVFAAAQLPLVRVPVRHAYSVAELNALLRPAMGSSAQPTQISETAGESGKAPACPKCGSEMVLRTARSGANRGEQFWGCSSFPKCRGVLGYAASPAP